MHPFRTLARAPGFTAVAILTLAVGIGANTAIFSVANALLLKPLPFAQPERLALINRQGGGPLSWPKFQFIREHARSFSAIAAFTSETFNLTGRGDPEQVRAARVSWNFFDVLGVRPALGRTFRPEEDRPGGDLVALARKAADMGHVLTLDGKDYTVAGVLPPGFEFGFLGEVDIVTPRVFELNLVTPQQVDRGVMFLSFVARLAPGATLAQANAELDALSSAYRRVYAALPDADPSVVVRAGNLRDEMVANARPSVLILFGAVALVLLIACANVSGLLLSRALARTREIAVRIALGADRGEIVRQLMAESLIVALAAGALGTFLGSAGVAALAKMAASKLPRASEIHSDWRVLLFTLGVSILAGVLFGLVPAIQVSRPDLASALRDESRGATASRGRNRWRGMLVVGQTALSTVLLISAGLLLRNFEQIRRSGAGVDSSGLLTMKIALPPARYATGAKMTAFYNELAPAVRSLPGVRAAAVSSALPFTPARLSPALPEGQPAVPMLQRPIFNIQTVSPGYVETMRVPLLAGREFTLGDDAEAPKVVMVNQALVRRFWPAENPLGKHILLGRMPQPCEVVGVLGDIRNSGVAAATQPEIYVPFAQLPWPAMTLVTRTAGDSLRYTNAVRERIVRIDRDQPVTAVRSMDEVLELAAAQPRFLATLIGALSATALLLALIGVYGMVAHSVAERTGEMGIRIALGAARGDILGLVVGQGSILAFAGIAIGVGVSLALKKVVATQLYGVSALDPLTYVVTIAGFAAVTIAASVIPARRAMRVDPVVALRGR
jgi:predicted permease